MMYPDYIKGYMSFFQTTIIERFYDTLQSIKSCDMSCDLSDYNNYYIIMYRQDEVVQLFAKLVCQLKGTEACMAISKIIDTHTKTEQHIKTQGSQVVN